MWKQVTIWIPGGCAGGVDNVDISVERFVVLWNSFNSTRDERSTLDPYYSYFKTPFPVLSAFSKVLGGGCRPCKPPAPWMLSVEEVRLLGQPRMKKARIPAGSALPCIPTGTRWAPSPRDGTGRCRAGLVTSCRGVWQVPPPGPPSHAVPWEVRRLSQSQLGVLQGWWAGTACSWLLLRLVLQAVQTPQPNPSGRCLGKNTLGSWSFVSLQSELLLFNTFPMNSYELTGLLDFPLI